VRLLAVSEAPLSKNGGEAFLGLEHKDSDRLGAARNSDGAEKIVLGGNKSVGINMCQTVIRS